jgi:hypothetical protein
VARKERWSLRDQLKKQQKVCTAVCMFVTDWYWSNDHKH